MKKIDYPLPKTQRMKKKKKKEKANEIHSVSSQNAQCTTL